MSARATKITFGRDARHWRSRHAARPIVDTAAIDRHIATEQARHVLKASLVTSPNGSSKVNTKTAMGATF
jgi:hypothetical protein